MDVIVLGIVMFVRPMQFWKALSSILNTDVGISTVVNALQPKNAAAPILVTDVGITTVCRLVRPEKAYASMAVMVVGIIIDVNWAHEVLIVAWDITIIPLGIS